MKLLLIVCSLFISQLALAETDCRIKSRLDSDLEEGVNRSIICSNVTAELVSKNLYSGDGGRLVLTVPKQDLLSPYEFVIRFRLFEKSKKISGYGTHIWNPDGSEFVLTSAGNLRNSDIDK